MKGQVLPYRTTGEDLTRMVEARARGRSFEQIRALGFSTKNFEGTLTAANALGFFDLEASTLTELGERYALAPVEDRPEILVTAMLEYEPYELLLEAVFARKRSEETTIEWIETWYGTNGYGSSQSNRSEGSTAFARFVEFCGLGSYLQGRRGHETRIQWMDIAVDSIERARNRDHTQSPDNKNERGEQAESNPVVKSDNKAKITDNHDQGRDGANSDLSLPFSNGRTARLSLPPKLSQDELDRLIKIIKATVAIECQDSPATPESLRSSE